MFQGFDIILKDTFGMTMDCIRIIKLSVHFTVVVQSLIASDSLWPQGQQHTRLPCPSLSQIHVHWVSGAIQPSHPLLPASPFASRLSQHQILIASRLPGALPFSPYICVALKTASHLIKIQSRFKEWWEWQLIHSSGTAFSSACLWASKQECKGYIQGMDSIRWVNGSRIHLWGVALELGTCQVRQKTYECSLNK